MKLSNASIVSSNFVIAVVIVSCTVLVGCQPQSSRDENLVSSGQNLATIGIAIHNYDAQTGTMPARYIPTADGNPGLSWRVEILPQLDLEDLYKEFRLDEPWDSPHNIVLVEKIPDIYRTARGNAPTGQTNYLAITGDDAALGNKPRSYHGVRDGTANTISVVEVDDAHAIEWTRPEDFAWMPDSPAQGLGWADDPRFLALLVDSSVQLIPNTINSQDLAAAYTGSGGEAIGSLKEYVSKDSVDGTRTRSRSRRHHFDLLHESIRKHHEGS